MSEKTYRIVRLQSENIKRLKAVEITPAGNLIEITGKNRQGKSSLLDSIYWALSGTSPIQSSPIRAGEQKARITLDLGTLTVTRRFTAQEDGTYTTSLIVENEDGARYKKEQSIVDALVGTLTMDPLEFTRKKPRDQYDLLTKLVPGVDFDEIAAARKKDFDERTDVNRRATEASAQAAGIVVPADTPDEPIVESALIEELEQAGKHNANIELRRNNRATVQRQIDEAEAENVRRSEKIKDLLAQVDVLKAEIQDVSETIAHNKQRLVDAGPLPEPIETSAITARITAARDINANVASKKQRAALLEKAKAYEEQSAALTKKIADRDEAKVKAISAAKIPVSGIGFGDGVVLLNGVPFDQASQAEQLQASIELALAGNPKLRIIRVRDGALLDDDSMKVVAQLADAHDIQVWIETVDSDRPGAIVIEDGSVVAAKLEAAE